MDEILVGVLLLVLGLVAVVGKEDRPKFRIIGVWLGISVFTFSLLSMTWLLAVIQSEKVVKRVTPEAQHAVISGALNAITLDSRVDQAILLICVTFIVIGILTKGTPKD